MRLGTKMYYNSLYGKELWLSSKQVHLWCNIRYKFQSLPQNGLIPGSVNHGGRSYESYTEACTYTGPGASIWGICSGAYIREGYLTIYTSMHIDNLQPFFNFILVCIISLFVSPKIALLIVNVRRSMSSIAILHVCMKDILSESTTPELNIRIIKTCVINTSVCF